MDKENETNSTSWSVPYWYVDAGAAMMNCMLLIDETGLKSGFLGSHNMDIPNIKSLLDIPEENPEQPETENEVAADTPDREEPEGDEAV